ncbi:hypothetical protein OZX68_03645 [Streptococcaceae bacterium ESL0729]|nr:hypothetical protein OZX68_03645 [Streptococcaceae bacterium ESL0729]
MIDLKKNKVTDKEIIYDYYLSDLGDFSDEGIHGIISVKKSDLSYKVIKNDEHPWFKSTHSKVRRAIHGFIKKDSYPETWFTPD